MNRPEPTVSPIAHIVDRFRYLPNQAAAETVIAERLEADEAYGTTRAWELAGAVIAEAKARRGEYVNMAGFIVRVSTQGYSVKAAG
jgi:hypothetical protein